MSLAFAVLCAEPDAGRRGRPSGPVAELAELGGVDVVARLRDDDVPAYEALYRVFHPRLIAIATNYVRSDAVAEEIAQDILFLAWERRALWRDVDELVVYLYATTRNRALNHLRHEGVVGRVGASAAAHEMNLGGSDRPENIDAAVERADLVDALTRALRRLPDAQRTAFELRWIHQLSYDDIAKIMGIAPATIRQHVSRARAALIPVALQLVDGASLQSDAPSQTATE